MLLYNDFMYLISKTIKWWDWEHQLLGVAIFWMKSEEFSIFQLCLHDLCEKEGKSSDVIRNTVRKNFKSEQLFI